MRKVENIPLDTELLGLFQALSETQSLTLAANRQGMSQAGASRALSKLRTIFNDNLFNKSGYGMQSTSRAKALAPRVIAILHELERLTEPDEFKPAGLTRTLYIGAVDNGVFSILSCVLKELFRQAPNARLEILPIGDDLCSNLKYGRMDLAIFPLLTMPPDFHEINLFETTYACVVRRGHPLSHYADKGQAPTFEEINQYRRMQITVHDGKQEQGYAIDEGAYAHPLAQDIAMSVPYFLAAPFILAETDFVLTLPRQTALRFAELAQLVVLPYPCDSTSFHTRLIWHHRVHYDPAIQWLRGLFTQCAEKMAEKHKQQLDRETAVALE